MTIIIRPLSLDDFNALVPLMDEIHDYHVAGKPGIFKHAEGPVFPREDIEGKLNDPDGLFLIALDGDALIGFLWGKLKERAESHTHHRRSALLVDALGVSESARGSGVGRALMEAAEVWGAARGAGECVLTVWQFNDSAIRFYERIGYAPELIRMSKRIKGS